MPVETALRVEFERRARDELRRARRRVEHQVEQARQFAIDNKIPLEKGSLRRIRRWFRDRGATLSQVQAAIEEGEHLVLGDGCRPWLVSSKHLGTAERDLLEEPRDKPGPPPRPT